MNIILTVVDKFSKKQHYILCHIKNKQTSLKKTVWLFIYEVFHYHDLPQSIVSDQGSQFISRMWKSLLKQLNINPLISISHHLETDSQTEHFNQKVKIELYFYVNYLQNNWVCWLSVIEFINNNAVNKSIKMTSFYFNKGFSLYIFFNSDITKVTTVQKKFQIHSVTEIAKIMNRILLVAYDNLTKAQGDMIKQVNYWHYIKDFVIEDEVIINIQNLISDWLIRALNNKRCEPFRILQQFHFFYKLNIFFKWYTTDTFHISNFIRVINSKQLPLTKQKNSPSESAVINNKNQAEWVLEEILNSQYSELNHHLQYKIYWTDCDLDLI